MIAGDTNVLVRCVTNDDAVQAKAAARLLESATSVFVAKSAILELEWVLRVAYHLPRTVIHHALGHPRIVQCGCRG